MIKIKFEEPNTPEWIEWRRKCEEATRKLIEDEKEGNPLIITDLYKQKNIKENVYMSHDGPFYTKCAYCEFLISNHDGDIDHYRPKKAVTNENDEIVMIEDKDGNSKPHKGYYWLAYDWKNLLPSCVKCNQIRIMKGKKVGKGRRFPVNGSHATEPGKENEEDPLLINPTTQDPEEHLEIDVKSGLIIALTERGQTCIDIFGLNIKDGYPEQRKSAAREVKALIEEYRHDESIREKHLEELLDIWNGKKPHSIAGRAMIRKELKPLIDLIDAVYND